MSTALGALLAPVPVTLRRLRGDLAPAVLARFAIVAVQFGILVSIARTFEIENSAFYASVKVIWIGWLVHHFLSRGARLPFFATLSMGLVIQTLGWHDGLALLGLGSLLIGAAHLPVSLRLRVGIVGALAALLILLRADEVPFLVGRIPPRVWPILGSMFMFRGIAYLFDMRHGTAPTGLTRAAAYFFMLPNACFPLFPVVDYKAFVGNQGSDETFRGYEIGLRWIWRGILQLLAYQIVYLFWVTDPMQATNLGDVAWYALTTFLLYLRVSGLFHLIVGLLRLFGFALPETHHLYYLSSSFTDFWRRINIYWKEFLTKVVFYPTYVRLKKLGEGSAMILATLVAFAATWFLHAMQLFWARGRFIVTWQDLVFWFGLGGLVVINMRWEATHRRPRMKTLSWRSGIPMGLRVAGTFASLCVLWVIWNTPTSGLGALAAASLKARPIHILAIIATLAAIGTAGALFAARRREGVVAPGAPTRPAAIEPLHPLMNRRSVLLAVASLALLVVGKRPGVLQQPALAAAIVEIEHVKFNRLDRLGRERGYYQDMNDALTLNVQMGRLDELAPPGWNDNPAKRLRDDLLAFDYAPSVRVQYKRRSFTTNSWGMRDRDRARTAAPGIFRIAVAGSSHEAGSGVSDEDNYLRVLESRLTESAGSAGVEVLNFAVDGYAPLQKLAMLEERGFGFSPDLVLYMAHSNELAWTAKPLPDLLGRGVALPHGEVADLVRQAGVRQGDSPRKISDKLGRVRGELLRATLMRLAADCRARGAVCATVLVQHPDELTRPRAFDSVTTIAREAGLAVIDLTGAFDSVSVRDSLFVAPWDTHPNAYGHGLMATRLGDALLSRGLLPTRGKR